MHYHSLHHRLLRQRRFRQILIGAMILSVFIAFIIVPVERTTAKRSIDSFSDALWWTVSTITTVGYGDVVPVTLLGRFLGIILQVLGTVMFGTLIAIISSNMSRGQEEMYWSRLFNRMDDLDNKLEKIERESRYLVTSETETEQKKTDKSKPRE